LKVIVGDIELTAEEAPQPIGKDRDTYIYISFLGKFDGKVQPVPKVLASELEAAIEALKKTCWRLV
jgi:hypothetical protein